MAKTYIFWAWASAYRQQTGHSPLVFCGREQNPCFSQLLHVAQALKEKSFPTPGFTAGMMLFFVESAPDVKGEHCLTNYRQNILPKGLRVIYVCFGIIQISLLGFPILPFFAGIFRIVESWTVYGSISVVLGSCVTSWMRWRCALGGILEGRPLLGRFTSVQSFFFHFFFIWR